MPSIPPLLTRAQKRQRPSLAFRRFKEQHAKLSTIYWTHKVGVEALRASLKTAAPKAPVVQTLCLPIRLDCFGQTTEDTLLWLDDYLNRCCLQLLASCSANLEAFLKDAALARVGSQGHTLTLGKLSRVGEAMASPIAKCSTIDEMLDFAEHLFGVDYGDRKKRWERAYKLRCIMVHTRGRINHGNARKLGIANPIIGNPPPYDWSALRADLAAAFDIAEITDSVLMTDEVRFWEMGTELASLAKVNQLPIKNTLWTYFHELGFASPLANERADLIRQFYP